MNKKFAWLVLPFFLVISGCGAKQEAAETPKTDASAVAAPSAGSKAPDLTTAGSVKGRVLFAGEAPAPKQISVKGNPECAVLHAGGNVVSEELLVKDGGIRYAFVYVKEGLEAYTFPVPAEPVTITNDKCVYSPHVIGAQTGQNVVFLNNDSTLHNVHAYPKANKAFNLGLPFAGMKQTKTFSSAEVMVPMKCDVHPWMQGFIGVLPHPYFSVTDEAGNFELKNLPAGDYTIEVWQEKLGVQSQKVRIEPQKTTSLDFSYKA